MLFCSHIVCLQPFNFDPNEKNKHKFMVQSLVAPDGDIQFDQLVCVLLIILIEICILKIPIWII